MVFHLNPGRRFSREMRKKRRRRRKVCPLNIESGQIEPKATGGLSEGSPSYWTDSFSLTHVDVSKCSPRPASPRR